MIAYLNVLFKISENPARYMQAGFDRLNSLGFG